MENSESYQSNKKIKLDSKYKYHLEPQIPFFNRYLYKLSSTDLESVKQFQTLFKLKYIFTDGTWITMDLNTTTYWVRGTKLVADESGPELFPESFEQFYNGNKELIELIYIYEDKTDPGFEQIDKFVEQGQLSKLPNPDLPTFRMDYDSILKVLLCNDLITCLAGGYYGIHDNKRLIWVKDFGSINLYSVHVSLDALLLGYCPNFEYLREHLINLYIQYKNIVPSVF